MELAISGREDGKATYTNLTQSIISSPEILHDQHFLLFLSSILEFSCNSPTLQTSTRNPLPRTKIEIATKLSPLRKLPKPMHAIFFKLSV
jgi:hypothetical protein